MSKVLIFLILALVHSLSALEPVVLSDEDIAVILRDYLDQGGEVDIEGPVPAELLARKDLVIKLLRDDLEETDVARLLEDLGASRYEDREHATLKLSRLGPMARKAVKAYMEENGSDPEIRMRCRRILEKSADREGVGSLNSYPDPDPVKVVRFLMAAGAGRDTVRLFAEDYFFHFSKVTDWGIPKLPESFFRQFIQVDGSDEAIIEWLGGEADSEVGTTNFRDAAKLLLAVDFVRFFPLLCSVGKHHVILCEVLMEGKFEGATPQAMSELAGLVVEGSGSQTLLPDGCFKVILAVLDSDDADAAASLGQKIMAKLRQAESLSLNQAAFFLRMAKLDPKTADELVVMKSKWFLRKELSESHALFHAMTRGGGHSYSNSFCEVYDFFHENAAATEEAMGRRAFPSDLFPAAAILSVQKAKSPESLDTLRNAVRNSFDSVKDNSYLLQAYVVAALATDLGQPLLDDALIHLLSNPQEHPYNLTETLCLLDGRHGRMVPKLLELATASPDDYYLSLAAILISPEDPAALAHVRETLLESESKKSARHAAWMLSAVDKMPHLDDIPKERLEWLVDISGEEDPYSLSKLMEAVSEPGEQAKLLELMRPNLDQMAMKSSYWTGLYELFWRKPDNQALIVDDVLRMIESEEEKLRDMGASMLASCPEAAAGHVGRIHEALKKEPSEKIRDSLIWGISNIGPRAAEMRDTIAGRDDNLHHYKLFCLANISSDRLERERCLQELIGVFQNTGQSVVVRMAGLVKNQIHSTRPFLKDVIRQVVSGESKDGRKVDSYAACEAVWGLVRESADDDALETLKGILRSAGEDNPNINTSLTDAVLWTLRTYYPGRKREIAPLLEDLPFRFRRSMSYRKLKG